MPRWLHFKLPVRYVTYQHIDKLKWNACIDGAFNGLVYAYSFYLDAMAKHWDALVLNDYEAVMPLTWNKKYGIQYLYQPFFCASLGVFGNNITPALITHFITAIPPKFKYWDISLNHGNHFHLNDFSLYERMNYVLPLDSSYENLHTHFRDNTKRNIKKAAQLNCLVKKQFSVDEIIVLAKGQSKYASPVDEDSYHRFKNLYFVLKEKKQAVVYGVFNTANELLASAVFFFSHKRAYYILVGNHPNGKTIGASHALINAFIKDYAGQNILLDFEGSDIRNLAFFYSSFGAREEKYAGLRLNRLPFWIRWFKKMPAV